MQYIKRSSKSEYTKCYWGGVVSFNGKNYYTKSFPLTDEGEKQAHAAVEILRSYLHNIASLEKIKPMLCESTYIDAKKQIEYAYLPKNTDDGEYVELIIKEVSTAFKLTQKQMFLLSRTYKFIRPRQVAQYLLYRTSNMNQDAIAAIFNQERTTILHSVKTIQNMIDTNAEFADKVLQIRSKINKINKRIFYDTTRTIHSGIQTAAIPKSNSQLYAG